uniref:SFRICE_003566 n=1 Tax=Spodoptera frugiperda TaxID=7108 RepID=A0A2H1WMM0_SPOFR
MRRTQPMTSVIDHVSFHSHRDLAEEAPPPEDDEDCTTSVIDRVSFHSHRDLAEEAPPDDEIDCKNVWDDPNR